MPDLGSRRGRPGRANDTGSGTAMPVGTATPFGPATTVGTARRVLVVLAGLVLAGCGADDGFVDIRRSQESASYDFNWTVPELLVSPPDGPSGPPFDAPVVEGRVVAVEDGAGMRWEMHEDGGDGDRILLPFGDPSADGHTVHVRFDVDAVIAGGLNQDQHPSRQQDHNRVVFGLFVADQASARRIRDSLDGKPFIVFLTDSAAFDYDTEVGYGVRVDGGLLCRRGEGSALECPGLEPGLGEFLGVDLVTADMLEPEA